MHAISKSLLAAAIAGALPFSANASTVEFQLTGNVTYSGIPNSSGETFTLDVFADNGSASLANQTWDSANVSKILLLIGGTTYQATYTASQYGGPAYAYGTPGDNWSTNASGILQTSSIDWVGTGNASKGPFTAFAVTQTQIENGAASGNGNTASSGTNDSQFINGIGNAQTGTLQVYDLAGNRDNLAYKAAQWTIVSPVSLPPGLSLLVSGLGLLGLAGRRRKVEESALA